MNARGTRLGAASAAAVLFLLLVIPAGCGGGGGDEGGNGEPAAQTGDAETGADEGAGPSPDGKAIFTSAGCGGCHTLEAAGSSGTAGPNLDESKPSEQEAIEQITNGGNGMPAFQGRLSEQEIQAVARFVVESTGGG